MKFLFIFGLLVSIGYVLAGCDEDYPKYKSCASKAVQFTKFKSKEEVETYCKSFDVSECKDFLEIVSTPSECLKDNNNMTLVAGLQLPYLAYCSKNKDNENCPITKFIVENFTEFDNINVKDLSDTLKETIINDCKDEECNKRMVTIGQSLEEPLLKNVAPSIFGNVYDFFTMLYGSYKEKKCDTITTNDGNKNDENSSARTMTKITYSFIGMILLSMVML
ncbi:hypothetical protein BCR32DRAFT_324161, partial [Anaeromyces robustus]